MSVCVCWKNLKSNWFNASLQIKTFFSGLKTSNLYLHTEATWLMSVSGVHAKVFRGSLSRCLKSTEKWFKAGGKKPPTAKPHYMETKSKRHSMLMDI